MKVRSLDVPHCGLTFTCHPLLNLLVNGYDLQGQRCPLPTYQSYPCPSLCVQDISMCPPSLSPHCTDPTHIYCVDGTCRTTCPSDLISACHCGDDSQSRQKAYPCAPNRVKITNFVAENKTQLSLDQCAQALSLTIPAWYPGIQQPIWWGQCPTRTLLPLNMTEPVFLALYGFYGSCLVSLLAWSLYKSLYEKVSVGDKGEEGGGGQPGGMTRR